MAVVAALVAAVPLGLLAAGAAFGEWTNAALARRVGYVPSGLARLGGHWHGLLPGYGRVGASGSWSVAAYVLSALAGVALLTAVVWFAVRLRRRAAGATVAPRAATAPTRAGDPRSAATRGPPRCRLPERRSTGATEGRRSCGRRSGGRGRASRARRTEERRRARLASRTCGRRGRGGEPPRPRRTRRPFADRLLNALAAWAERALASDELARRPGLLQGLDPRVKLVSLLALIATAALSTRMGVYSCC